MTISDAQLGELIDIHRDEWGEELSIEEARALGLRLTELYRLLSKPLPHEDDQPEATLLGSDIDPK